MDLLPQAILNFAIVDMPAKDIFHDAVKHALVQEGWAITHDPLSLKVGRKDLFVDLGAERFLAAEKKGEKIAVEIKSFVGSSEVENLRNAVGQYVLYQTALAKIEPERTLYLAIRQRIYADVFEEEIGRMLLQQGILKLIVFDSKREAIVQWIG
jgi:XisH protein